MENNKSSGTKEKLVQLEEDMTAQFEQSFSLADNKNAEDDEINDVAAMGGVDLVEETRNLAPTEGIGSQIRSVKEEYLTPMPLMQTRLNAGSRNTGLQEPGEAVSALLSHAVQERLKNLVEKLAVVVHHRIDFDNMKQYEVSSDVKGKLKFLEELDRGSMKRSQEAKRERLNTALDKLMSAERQMQQIEMKEAFLRAANVAALEAIGQRKQARLNGSNGSRRRKRNRRSRTAKILQMLMEQERKLARTLQLYKAYFQ